jgi:hypothetical protein
MSPDVAHTPVRPPVRLHPKLILASFLVAAVMLPAGLLLAGIGIAVLKLAGGAAHDTGMVVLVAAYGVTDVWGGGIVRTLTRLDERSVAIAWVIARLVLLGLLAVPMHGILDLVPVQLALAAVASWTGARVARTQSNLRRAEAARADHAERRRERSAAVGM